MRMKKYVQLLFGDTYTFKQSFRLFVNVAKTSTTVVKSKDTPIVHLREFLKHRIVVKLVDVDPVQAAFRKEFQRVTADLRLELEALGWQFSGGSNQCMHYIEVNKGGRHFSRFTLVEEK